MVYVINNKIIISKDKHNISMDYSCLYFVSANTKELGSLCRKH